MKIASYSLEETYCVKCARKFCSGIFGGITCLVCRTEEKEKQEAMTILLYG